MRGGPLGALPRLSPTARRALAVCALLAGLSAVALVAQAWALASAVAAVVAGGSSPGPPAWLASLGGPVAGSLVGGAVGGWLVVLAGAVAARAGLSWATQVVAARAAAGAKAELRAALLDRSLGYGPEWTARRGATDLTVLATKGLDALDAYFTVYLPALVTALVVPLGVGAAILVADWPSAVLVALTVPLVPVFAVLIGLRTRDRVAAAADSTARLSRHLYELVRALPVLTAFRRAAAQVTAVRRVSDEYLKATLETLRVAFCSALILELVATLSVALVAVGIGLRLVSGDLGLAVGLTVLILAPECYLPLRAVGAAHHASEDGIEAVRRVADVLAEPLPPRGSVAPPAGPVTVEDLRVRRRDADAPDGLSFTAYPGRVVRLDSPSGSGKSTAFAVLLGFVPPTSGRVTVGGVALTDLDPVAWRRQLAWVPQRPVFTGGTVADELRLAGGAAGREELVGVAARVGVAQLLDRPVAELSTGERQRVAVARALLRVERGARLLLLDEPTAHLDEATAARVMAEVRRAADSGVAVILAAHRAAPDTAESPSPAPAASPVVEPASPVRPRLAELVSRRTVAGAVVGAVALLAGVALTATSGWLIAKASQQPPILMLSVAIVGVRTFGLARAGLRYAERLLTHDAAFRTAGELRARLWQALVRLGPVRTLGLRRGEGLRRLVDDVDAVRDLTPRVLVPPLVAALVCAGAVAVQTALLPVAGLVLAGAVLVAGLGGAFLAVRLERRATAGLAGARRRIAARTLTLLDAAAELIAYGADRRHRAALSTLDNTLTVRARRQAYGAGAATALIIGCTGAATVAAVGLAAAAVAGGRLDPVLAAVLALVPLALAEVLVTVPPAAAHYDPLRAAHHRITATLTAAPPAVPTADVTPGAHTNGAAIRLCGVDVRWPGAAEPALHDVHLEIPPGTHVAVTGPSGAGKSTLLALLLGFLAPERGTAQLPARVAWCPQEPQLVSTTIRENLRLPDPYAADERLADALRGAGLADWHDKLDTRLDGHGATTSGGEAQRLALARALVAAADAELVLLDEPTAHLDRTTAHAVLSGLERALAGRTVLHVTHRPDEAARAELRIELRDGRLQVAGKGLVVPHGPGDPEVRGGAVHLQGVRRYVVAGAVVADDPAQRASAGAAAADALTGQGLVGRDDHRDDDAPAAAVAQDQVLAGRVDRHAGDADTDVRRVGVDPRHDGGAAAGLFVEPDHAATHAGRVVRIVGAQVVVGERHPAPEPDHGDQRQDDSVTQVRGAAGARRTDDQLLETASDPGPGR